MLRRAETPRADWRPAALAGVAIVGAGLLVYANSFPGTFVFDDYSSVVENASIRRLWPLAPVLQPPEDAGVGGRPLANLTFALSHALSGGTPASYRAFNLALHLASALVLFGIFRRTLLLPRGGTLVDGTRALLLGAAVALTWTVHPLPTGVVNYISQRTEALAAFFALVTLYAFLRATERDSRWWRALAVGACASGMASKEIMVGVPVIVFLFDRTFIVGTFRAAWQARRTLHLSLLATWLVLAGLMAASPVDARGVGFGLGVDAATWIFTQARNVWHYLALVVYPRPLVFDYGWDYLTDAASAAPYLIGCAGGIVATVLALRFRPMAGFFSATFLLLLAPTTSIVPIVQQPIAESRMYLPLAAVVAALVAGVHAATKPRPRTFVMVALAVALALATLTVRRNRDYRAEVTLWSDTVQKRPQNARAHGNLGAALLRAGNPHDAIAACREALRLRPNYANAHANLGQALLATGDIAAATSHLRAAHEIEPASISARYNLGVALAQSGDDAAALALFMEVIQLRPGHARAQNNLSVLTLRRGRNAAAQAHARAALQVEPEFAEAHYNLGNAVAAAGRSAEAAKHFGAALRFDPRLAKAANNLGVLELRAGRPREAAARFEEAVRIDPAYAEARANLEAVRRAGGSGGRGP